MPNGLTILPQTGFEQLVGQHIGEGIYTGIGEGLKGRQRQKELQERLKQEEQKQQERFRQQQELLRMKQEADIQKQQEAQRQKDLARQEQMQQEYNYYLQGGLSPQAASQLVQAPQAQKSYLFKEYQKGQGFFPQLREQFFGPSSVSQFLEGGAPGAPMQQGQMPPQQDDALQQATQLVVSQAQNQGTTSEQQVQNLVNNGVIDESYGSKILRNIVRTASRFGETALETIPNVPLGALSGIRSLANKIIPDGLGIYSPEFIEMTEPQERQRLQQAVEGLSPEQRRASMKAIEKYTEVPKLDLKSSVFKQIEKHFLPKDYLEPQSEAERHLDEFTATATALMVPFPGAQGIKLANKAGKALGMAGAGQIAKWGSQKIGVGEAGQELAKLGTMAITGLVGPRQAKSFAKAKYDRVASMLDKAKVKDVSAKVTENIFEPYNEALRRGNITPSPKLAAKMEHLSSYIPLRPIGKKPATVPVAELMDLRKGLNSFLAEKAKPSDANAVAKIKDGIDKALNYYAKASPEAAQIVKSYQDATDLYHAANTTTRFSDWIGKNSKKISTGATIGSLFFGGPKAAAITAVGTQALRGLGIGADRLFRTFKYPVVRKLYTNTLKNILAKNPEKAVKSLDLLGRTVQKKLGNRSWRRSGQTIARS